MQYRSEIDGLRAVAVVPVIAFHAGIAGFTGGYIGVDVFFVISGYLITSIISTDLRNDNFYISRFYERRARRILPTLFLVMLCCIPFAWLWILPVPLEAFSKSLSAVSLFSSNIFFWKESGYFSQPAELTPLLHTWSLAVEEQFYLLFPVALLWISRLGSRRAFWLIAFAALASFLLCEWASRSWPAANFYFAATRAWELLAGSLCALLIIDKPIRNSDFAGALGLGLIGFSIFAYDDQTRFPSGYALIPVIGTCLIILFAGPKSTVARILGSKPLVGIGLLSYSAYLWHQPLFAFARIRSGDDPSLGSLLGLTLAAFGFAYVSWRFVETPFRHAQQVSRRTVFAFSAAGVFFFVGIGIAGWLSQGAPQRYSEAERNLLALTDYKKSLTAYSLGRCLLDYEQGTSVLMANACFADVSDKSRIIVFGDSEAAHLMFGTKVVFPSRHVDQWTATSCRPFVYPADTPRCRQFNDTFLRMLPRAKPGDIVIVGGNWIRTYEELGNDNFVRLLAESLSALAKSKARIVIVGNTPEFSTSPINNVIVSGNRSPNLLSTSLDFEPSNAAVRRAATQAGIQYFDPLGMLCRDRRCFVVRDGMPTMFDEGHLTPYGSVLALNGLPRTIGER